MFDEINKYPTHQATKPWDGKCFFCGEDELDSGSDGGQCMYCGHTTLPPIECTPSVSSKDG